MHDSNSSDQNHLEQCKEIAEREREKERESWRELYDHLSIPFVNKTILSLVGKVCTRLENSLVIMMK